MVPLEDARKRLLGRIHPLASEPAGLTQCLGRYMAEDLVAFLDQPPFDNSAMDGYAVRARDIARASAQAPVKLRRAGRIPAGEVAARELQPGECMRIYTGSAMPLGADAVVMQEDTKEDPSDGMGILFLESVKPWENLRLKGEDIKRGRLLLRQGDRINAARLALLGAQGLDTVKVGGAPAVGVLATGSELLEPGAPWTPGKIYESNRLMLATLVAQAGGLPRVYPLVADTLAETREAMEKALAECDAVVTSGGVSVGDLDFVKPAFAEAGGTLEFWKVSMKPGKPFVFGHREDALWFGLPGNPVSALVTFLMLVRPALLKMQGAGEIDLPSVPGELAEALSNPGNRRHFMRVAMDSQGRVTSTGTQASHILSSLARAEGLVDVPPETEWPQGTQVKVLRWD